jgi:hypothetical protein
VGIEGNRSRGGDLGSAEFESRDVLMCPLNFAAVKTAREMSLMMGFGLLEFHFGDVFLQTFHRCEIVSGE